MCLSVIVELTDNLLQQVALLAWVSTVDIKAHYRKLKDQFEGQECDEKERERWKLHPLYKSDKKQLETMCRQWKIPVKHTLPKFQLVKLKEIKTLLQNRK